MKINFNNNIILNIFYKKLNFKGNNSLSNYYLNTTLYKFHLLNTNPLYIFETAIFNILKPIELIYEIKNNKYKFKTLTLYKSISQASILIIKNLKYNYKENFNNKLYKEIYNLYKKQGLLYNKYIIDLKKIFIL